MLRGDTPSKSYPHSCRAKNFILRGDLVVQIGHAGTLDPMATGLLIICTGKATKSIDSFQAMHKEYSGQHFKLQMSSFLVLG